MKKLLPILIMFIFCLLGTYGAEAQNPRRSSHPNTSHHAKKHAKRSPVQQGETKTYGDCLTTRIFTLKKGQESQLTVEYPINGDPQLVTAIRQNIKKCLNPEFTGSLNSPDGLMLSVMKDKSDVTFGGEGESLNEDIKVIYSDSRLITFQVSGWNYMGGAHGMNWTYATTFLVPTGSVFDLDMLPSFSVMRPYIMKGLAEHYETSVSGLDDVLFNPEEIGYPNSVAVASEGITFYYQPYEIAPYAMGAPQSTVPVTNKIIELLSPAGQRFFK